MVNYQQHQQPTLSQAEKEDEFTAAELELIVGGKEKEEEGEELLKKAEERLKKFVEAGGEKALLGMQTGNGTHEGETDTMEKDDGKLINDLSTHK